MEMCSMHLDLYYVDMKYIRSISKVQNHVYSVSPQSGKESRPFLGVITIIENKKYCIPLTSPKEKFFKKSQIDFIKIFDTSKKDKNGTFKIIGILNINNMIPVDNDVIHKIDLGITPFDSPKQSHYKHLMQKQISWCRDNSDVICNRASKVYRLVTQEPEYNRKLVSRSFDFKKLETVLQKYLSKKAERVEDKEVRSQPKDVRGLIKKKAREIHSKPHNEEQQLRNNKKKDQSL